MTTFPAASIVFDDNVATPAYPQTIRTWTVPLLGAGIYEAKWYISGQPGGAVDLTVNGTSAIMPETLNIQHEFEFSLGLLVGDVVKIVTTSLVNTSYPIESDLVLTQIG